MITGVIVSSNFSRQIFYQLHGRFAFTIKLASNDTFFLVMQNAKQKFDVKLKGNLMTLFRDRVRTQLETESVYTVVTVFQCI